MAQCRCAASHRTGTVVACGWLVLLRLFARRHYPYMHIQQAVGSTPMSAARADSRNRQRHVAHCPAASVNATSCNRRPSSSPKQSRHRVKPSAAFIAISATAILWSQVPFAMRHPANRSALMPGRHFHKLRGLAGKLYLIRIDDKSFVASSGSPDLVCATGGWLVGSLPITSTYFGDTTAPSSAIAR